MKIKKFLISLLLCFSLSNLSFAAESFSISFEDLFFLLMRHHTQSVAQDEFYLEQAICKDPSSIFEYNISSVEQSGLVKIQITCNVINIYFDEQMKDKLSQITEALYSDTSKYRFIHRNEIDHFQKHLTKEEAEIAHYHVMHLDVITISIEELRPLIKLFVKNNFISVDTATDLIDNFRRFKNK